MNKHACQFVYICAGEMDSLEKGLRSPHNCNNCYWLWYNELLLIYNISVPQPLTSTLNLYWINIDYWDILELCWYPSSITGRGVYCIANLWNGLSFCLVTEKWSCCSFMFTLQNLLFAANSYNLEMVMSCALCHTQSFSFEQNMFKPNCYNSLSRTCSIVEL